MSMCPNYHTLEAGDAELVMLLYGVSGAVIVITTSSF